MEIYSLFGKSSDDISDEEYLVLASIICDTWAARLKQQFPEKAFVIEILDPDEIEGETAILFRQAT